MHRTKSAEPEPAEMDHTLSVYKGSEPMRKFYLHSAKMQFNAPSGCILISDTNDLDDGAVIMTVDAHGLVMTDEEAETFAEEVCRRWNAANDKASECRD